MSGDLAHDSLRTSRILLTLPAAFLMLVPPLVDFNESHLMNPLWVGHARLHTAWLLSTNSLVSALALVILWRRLAGTAKNSLLLAASLVSAILVGFFVAAATKGAYGGTLTDPNGVAVSAGPVDANLAGFSVCLLMVIASIVLARKVDA